jgi:hypothetical protein
MWGVKLVTATIMKGASNEEEFWMFPTSGASYMVIKLGGEVESVLDHYDLTGQFDTQMPDFEEIQKRKERLYLLR